MPDQRNAFLPGEWAMIANEAQMRAALQNYRNREEVIAALRPHVGERIRIVGYGFPHGSGVRYDLQGIDQPVWEECLIDWSIDPDDPPYLAAIQCYEIGIESHDGERYVTIRDKSGKLYSKTWHTNPEHAVEQLTAIAKMRTRIAFESRFGFTADYNNERPTANQALQATAAPPSS